MPGQLDTARRRRVRLRGFAAKTAEAYLHAMEQLGKEAARDALLERLRHTDWIV